MKIIYSDIVAAPPIQQMQIEVMNRYQITANLYVCP